MQISRYSSPLFYEYKIKSGDTLAGLIKSMYGIEPTNTRYQEFISYILSINPQIKNSDFIRAGDILRLSEYPPQSQPSPVQVQPKTSAPPLF